MIFCQLNQIWNAKNTIHINTDGFQRFIFLDILEKIDKLSKH
jgi:hypothetical protein